MGIYHKVVIRNYLLVEMDHEPLIFVSQKMDVVKVINIDSDCDND